MPLKKSPKSAVKNNHDERTGCGFNKRWYALYNKNKEMTILTFFIPIKSKFGELGTILKGVYLLKELMYLTLYDHFLLLYNIHLNK